MDQDEYDKKYNRYPWWSNFFVTAALSYIFVVFFLGIFSLFYWQTHLVVLIVSVFGIWFWNPITNWFQRTVERFFE
jgi:hypothetical protein